MKDFKIRPRKVYKDLKGYYFLINKKKKYIQMKDKNISEKQLLKLLLKNISLFKPIKKRRRKAKAKKKVGETKGQQPMITQGSAFSVPLDKKLALTPAGLVMSREIVPYQPTTYYKMREQNIKEPSKKENEIFGIKIDDLYKFGKVVYENLTQPRTTPNVSNLGGVEVTEIETERPPNNKPKLRITSKRRMRPPPSMKELDERLKPKVEEIKEPSEISLSDIVSSTGNTKRITPLDVLKIRKKAKQEALSGVMPSLKVKAKTKAELLAETPSFSGSTKGVSEPAGTINTLPLSNKKRLKTIIEEENKDNTIRYESKEQDGEGAYTNYNDGLYENEIENILMEKTGGKYIPVIANDEVSTLKRFINKDTDQFGFVVNTDNSTGSGKHWRAVYISRPDKSVEYYDSLVSIPDKQFIKGLKELVEKMEDDVYYKLKINMVKDQSDDTSNCGFYAIGFLDKRFNGKSFKDASLFSKLNMKEYKDDTIKGEKEIEKYKNYI